MRHRLGDGFPVRGNGRSHAIERLHCGQGPHGHDRNASQHGFDRSLMSVSRIGAKVNASHESAEVTKLQVVTVSKESDHDGLGVGPSLYSAM